MKLGVVEQKLTEKYTWLSSSQDRQKIALTIKGFLLAITPVVLLLAGAFKIDLGEGQWRDLVEMAWETFNSISLAVGSILALWGVIRKLKK